jgi:cytochrome c-type biogenesis protein CcmH/NrfG
MSPDRLLNLARTIIVHPCRCDLPAAGSSPLALDEAVVRPDPVNVTKLFNLGADQRNAGRFDAAIASYRTVLSLTPGRGGAHA